MINTLLKSSKSSCLTACQSYFGSHAQKVSTIIETKNNPEKTIELRGQ